jgi:DNA replication and checkpoint protein
MDSLALLDTPKRQSLSTRSADLRAVLKDWEKSFASTHGGQKPGKDDIKADPDISKKYKEYNRLRDVLAHKLGVEALGEPKSPSRATKRTRADSGISFTPRKSTNRLPDRHPNQIDPYDHPNSASPKQIFFSAIGPTPQRDGKVLGLFDLLSNSGRSSQATPSARKRKIDVLYSEHEKEEEMVAQTPGRQQQKSGGDLLEHLTGDVFDSASRRKHSRTPASEGKKFMLSQFFATPTTLRYTALGDDGNTDGRVVDKTPLRSMVLGLSPSQPINGDSPGPDATPAYLKRSFTFKERLLSASNVSTTQTTRDQGLDFTSPMAVRRGPRPLQRTRSMPKLLSQIVQDLRKLEDEQNEDDLDALREIEGNVNIGVQANNSQDLNQTLVGEIQLDGNIAEAIENQPPKVWKKKGQKRTTRRSTMRPGTVKLNEAPKWVAADEDEEIEDELLRAQETQLARVKTASSLCGDLSEDELADMDKQTQTQTQKRKQKGNISEDEVYDVEDEDSTEQKGGPRENPSKSTTSGTKKVRDDKKAKTKSGRTINPNAHSHMNFRSLKIRNKNSKAKGGRFGGRFGKGRR